ncbi:MAG: alpha/beta hydrolase [Planctomycetes bacterium]|nr:alpha/beta hydrolase [Planctomycetota bacterium]
MSLTVALVLVFLVLVAYVALALRWRTPRREPDAWVELAAADGHPLALGHHRARGPARREPVILCHGLSANRFNLDLDDGCSLARRLAARGFEVYVLELRGRGRSRRPGLLGRVPRQRFDDYVTLDLPAAIEAVRRRHGAARVHWVGHSMGGLVAYALLARDPAAPLRALVTIGSPVRMHLPGWLRAGLRLVAAARLPMIWGEASFLIAPLVGWLPHPPLPLLVNPRNVSGARLRAAAANLVADVSAGELAHFARMACAGRFESADGACDYAAGLARVTTPTLVVAGTVDRVAAPAGVRAGHDLLGGPRRYRLCGREGGDPIDFGHGDLVLGDHAPGVVFPEVERWLEAHDPAPSPSAPTAPVAAMAV